MGKIKDTREYMGASELMQPATWKAVAAEVVGTMLLTLVVCGSCIGFTFPPTNEQIAFAVGIIVFCMVQVRRESASGERGLGE